MITLKITEGRLGGANNTNTPFARMLKAVREFLGPQLIDNRKPNVIFVLTNFHAWSPVRVKKELPNRIKTIKYLSAKLLGVINPPIALSENKPEEYGVKKDEHNWHQLNDGGKHPLSLFSELIEKCKRNQDLIGKI